MLHPTRPSVPAVRAARKSMCKQLTGLMLSQWHMHRHICENYNPHKTADTTEGDCSGTRFYHWVSHSHKHSKLASPYTF